METLIHSINKIQDQFRELKEDPIELPQIVVVGLQSAGKSSVLESMVQRSFLPRGEGLVTRCPLILQLMHCPEGDARRKVQTVHAGQKRDHTGEPKVVDGAGGGDPIPDKVSELGQELEEWAEFPDSQGQRFHLDDVHQEILKRTEQLVGGNLNIGKKPIILRVFSPRVTTLTLVDLPGITKCPMGDQPKDIEEQIRSLISSFIEKELSIILAVVPAVIDMTTNDSIKIAKEMDPKDERTLVVVTKLDRMAKGTNATDVLTGKIIPIKLGIIGVVNRSAEDIKQGKSIADALKDEEKFLRKHYPDIADKNGTPFLAQTLNRILINHIRKYLPSINSKLTERIKMCQEQLDECGECVMDEKKTLMHIITDFTKSFSSKLDGEWIDIQSPVLLGGSKISFLFECMRTKFLKVNPCSKYSLEEVTVAIRNTNGLRPPFIVSQPAFEALMKPLVAHLRKPALDCVASVMEEMRTVCSASIPRDASVRFPLIKAEITDVVRNMLEECSRKTLDMVKEAVFVEERYITYNHFDDFKTKRVEEILKVGKWYTSQLPFDSSNYAEEMAKKMVGEGVCHGSLATMLERTHQDDQQIVILGEMLCLYYKVVAEKIQDTVAKTVMAHLVGSVKDNVQTQLVLRLMSSIDKLFKENGTVTAKRIEKQKELKALKNSIREIKNIVPDC